MIALGIDLGTTKVAAVICDESHGVIEAVNSPHNASIPDNPAGVCEQDTAKIIECTRNLLFQLPEKLRREISAIGITGQMHSLLIKDGSRISPLVTWQDHRCGENAIAEYNRISGLDLHEGFGGTSLARMAEAGTLTGNMQAATISDYLSMLMTNHDHIITDPTHAASWGIYDQISGNWNINALNALDIPLAILPQIRPSGESLGTISPAWSSEFSLNPSAIVANAIGDNQASILGTGQNFTDEIYLTLGTGAQLSVVTDNFSEKVPDNIEIRPFPGNRNLLVSAPLCGGAAFALLADTVNKFRIALGENPLDRGILLDKLDDLAIKYLQEKGIPEISVKPHFSGERYAPALRGSIDGLTLDNSDPGALAAALAFGIVQNLKKDFPAGELINRKVIIGSGNAVRLVKTIQYAIGKLFNLPLKLAEGKEEAAGGAAKYALLTAIKNACISK